VIPVFEPVITDDDIASVVAALKRGEISGSFGEALGDFERNFADYCGTKHGIAVSSGTTALHIAVTAAGIGRGDEVLVSASTNIATALAAYHNGAVAVPVDSERVTWNLDLELLDDLVTPKTKAIIPVHLFGHPVDMDKLMAWANERGIMVIEDCAESHGATCRGRMTGSYGAMACFSFYANKVITTGEGGMIVTNDDKLAERLRLLRNLGFTTPRFRHEVPAFNFRMTGYQAAMGVAQLARIEEIVADKRRVASLYSKHLAGIRGLRLPAEMPWAKNVYWMYAVVVESEFPGEREELRAYLTEQGIDTRTFFCPMNQQPFLAQQEGFRAVECPVADDLWKTGFYLPSTHTLGEGSIAEISGKIRAFAER
jgi:perosamine synthetase